MIENTVLISLEKFKELNDFEHDIKSGKTLFLYTAYNPNTGTYFDTAKVYTTTDAVIEVLKSNESCYRRIGKLSDEVYELKNKPAKKLDFETMSILQFIKYKWSKK